MSWMCNIPKRRFNTPAMIVIIVPSLSHRIAHLFSTYFDTPSRGGWAGISRRVHVIVRQSSDRGIASKGYVNYG